MRLIIHRGSHEIGGSCVELISGENRIILDLGMPLVNADRSRFDANQSAADTGADLVKAGVLPDISGIYAWDMESRPVDALFLSHAHMDHYGFTNYTRPDLPVYCGAATHELMKINEVFTPFAGIGGQIKTFVHGVPVQCADFRVTPFLVDHSAFDAYAFLIEADGKNILYSGDFREHGRKPGTLPALFKALCGISIDMILLEGTMFGRPEEKVLTEKELEEEIVQTIGMRDDISLACFSGQNIDRLVTFYRASLRCQRSFVVDIYTANVLAVLRKYARIPYPSGKYPNLKVFYPYWISKRLGDSGHEDMLHRFKQFKISRSDIEMQQSKLLMLVRPSMCSDLKKIDFTGGTFIYSMWKGYQQNRDMIRLLEFIKQRGMLQHHIHSSGHATIETLKKVVDVLQPGEVIPIHTFFPDEYQSLGVKIRCLNDGEVYWLD